MSTTTFRLKRSAVPGKVPTTGQLELGEVAINTYDGKVYIKKDDGTASVVEVGGANLNSWKEYQYTADSGQTVFTGSDVDSQTLRYLSGYVQVFLNGVLLDPNIDYTANNGTSIVLTTGAFSGDNLQVSTFSQILGTGNNHVENFTGDALTTDFTLSQDPLEENNISVFIDGVYQQKNSFSVSGTTLSLSEAPDSDASIEVLTSSRNVSLNELEDLTLSGEILLNSNAEGVVEATFATLSATTVSAISSSLYRSVNYQIQVKDSAANEFMSTQINLIHNDSDVFITQYGTLFTGDSALGTFDALLSGGNILLQITPASTNTMKSKIKYSAMPV